MINALIIRDIIRIMALEMIKIIKEAEEKRVAIGHFNISDITALRGITAAVRRISEEFHILLPVLIGVSEGEEKYIGRANAVSLVKNLRDEGMMIFLNADHTRSLERLEAVVRAGYDSATFDASKLPFAENLKLTAEAVKMAKNINPDFVVEGELGYIGESSEIMTALPAGAAVNSEMFTKPEEAVELSKTGIDMIAPAIGNIHGMFKNMPNPRIDSVRAGDIRKSAGIPLVLHGGSGIADEDFISAINSGVAVIHINTEIRLAWREGIEEFLRADKDEVAPYKILPGAEGKIAEVVYNRLKLFNKLG